MARRIKRVKRYLAESQMVKVFALVCVATIILGFSALPASAQLYQPKTNFVSVLFGKTSVTNPTLLGYWDIARSPISPWWINSTIGGVSVSFNTLGTSMSPVIATIQLPNREGSSPAIGIVFWYE